MNQLKNILFCFIFVNVFAGLDDHLKKAEKKGNYHNIRNIDFIYMINLDQRPEKFEQASKGLNQYGIYPYRFSAVNGWKLSTEAINDVGLKYQTGMTPLMATTYPNEAGGKQSHEFMSKVGRTYFSHCMSRGAIGCALSHISVLQDAWESNYETIWVLEDDVEVVSDAREIPELIDQLDELVGRENWDVLFTDQNYRDANGQYVIASGAAKRPDLNCSIEARYSNKYTVNKDINLTFRKIAARFGTHSMIIRRSGIRKLLKYAKAHMIFLPYDMDNYLAPGINRYSFTYDIVTNMTGALSDNGSPQYEKGGK